MSDQDQTDAARLDDDITRAMFALELDTELVACAHRMFRRMLTAGLPVPYLYRVHDGTLRGIRLEWDDEQRLSLDFTREQTSGVGRIYAHCMTAELDCPLSFADVAVNFCMKVLRP